MARERTGLTKIEIPQLINERDAFRARIIGQEEAVGAFALLYAKLHSGIRPTRPGPVDIKYLAGPSGVGKTEMVYTLADLLAQGEDNPRGKVIKINGGEYHSEHLVARLVGSPPGYRGSEDPHYPDYKDPALFSQENLDKNRIYYTDQKGESRSVVIILVDEAEKAHDAMHRAFLSVLDKGEMTIGNNKTSNFSDAVIFYTSNVGNQQVEQARRASSLTDSKATEIVTDAFLSAFPPEFRGRIKELIIFKNLDEEAIKKIAAIKIKKVIEDFAENGIRIGLDLSPEALDWLIANGYNPSEGVRALEKVVERDIHDKLVIAHVGVDIHRKAIYADYEAGEPGLTFYFAEGVQLPDIEKQREATTAVSQNEGARPVRVNTAAEQVRVQTAQTSQSTAAAQTERVTQAQTQKESDVPKIPQMLKVDLLDKITTYGINDYVSKRNDLEKKGLLAGEDANAQPEIQIAAAWRTVERMRVHGVHEYISERDQVNRAGIVSTEAMNSWQPVLDASAKRLRDKLRIGVDFFTSERDELVNAGIGTIEYWNQILYEKSN